MTDKTASGADLARQALAAYKATAKTAPTTKPKPRRTKRDRGSGRDPIGLGGVLGTICTEQGWELSLDGGSILDQWATLCPDLVGRAEPVAYDAHLGRLDLRPASPAYATQLRLFGGQLCKRVNDKVGRTVLRTIRVLPVGPVASRPLSVPAPTTSTPPADPGPVKTRDTASAGYRATLAAIRRPEPHTPSAAVTQAQQAQARGAAREPETAFAATVAAMQDLTPAALDDAEQIRKAAIARKYGSGQDLKTAFGAG